MPTESLQVTDTLPAAPERVWRAWLDSKEHTAMTGGAETVIQAAVGATFQASDGYIVGMNVELEPYRRIVQTWRTSEFPPGAPHSKLEILLDAEGEGTRITLNQTEIPEGQAERYREGWRDYYFNPMKEYFGRAAAESMEAAGARENRLEADAEQQTLFELNQPAPLEKGPARKPAAKKPAAKKAAPAKKAAAAKKPAVKAKAAPAKKAAAKKSVAKKPAAKKPAAKKAKAAPKAKKAAAKKAPAKTAAKKKSAAKSKRK